jgi:ribosomal protein L13E
VRRSEELERRRRTRAQYRHVPEYAKSALEVANLFVLSPEPAHWPQGTLFALTKIVELKEVVAERLGRDPTVGEMAAAYLRQRYAELAVQVATEVAGMLTHGQSGPVPGNQQSNDTPDPTRAEQDGETHDDV